MRPGGILCAVTLVLLLATTAGGAQTPASQAGTKADAALLQELRRQIEVLKADYDKRIKELETQVEQLQVQMLRAAAEPEPAAAGAPAAAAPVQTIPGALNPAIGVVGNLLARGDSRKVFNEEGTRIDNRANLREAEIDMRVPVDPYADGVLIASLEQEAAGQFAVGIEEGYVTIKKLPFLEQTPLGLRLKAGRFRPFFGRNNVLHTHDLPQSMRPLPVQEFLGPEGFAQNGLSGTFYIPTPWDREGSLDATVELLSGGEIALSPDISSRNSYLGHLRWFRTFRTAHNLELGWSSYYRPSGAESSSTALHGVDLTYRWKPLRRGQWQSFLLSGELMFARRAYPEAAAGPDVAPALEGLQPGHGKPLGYTLFGQWQFDRRTYAGLRWDQADVLFDPGLKRRSITPYLSYYFSEFLRFRLNYEHRWSDLSTDDGRNSVFAELNWIFGAHPPEPYWVNR
jgi:hypothetical protein